jgi:sulfatase maturation enzyme AslB (radical SAM superfamily)
LTEEMGRAAIDRCIMIMQKACMCNVYREREREMHCVRSMQERERERCTASAACTRGCRHAHVYTLTHEYAIIQHIVSPHLSARGAEQRRRRHHQPIRVWWIPRS